MQQAGTSLIVVLSRASVALDSDAHHNKIKTLLIINVPKEVGVPRDLTVPISSEVPHPVPWGVPRMKVE